MQLLLLLALLTLSSQQSFQENIQDVLGTPPTGTTKNSPLETLSSRANVSDDSVSGVSCTRRSDEKPGKCVYYYQCNNETQQIITDNDLIDVRAPPECPKHFEVCCLLPNVELSAPRPANFSAVVATVATTPTTVPTVTSTKSNSTVVTDTTPATTGVSATRCGYSNLGDSDTFRERGEEHSAKLPEFPWVVAILNRSAPSGAWSRAEYVGAGTLIHPQVVLTAAHKVYYKIKAKDLKVRAGECSTESQSEVYKHQERDVGRITLHTCASVLVSVALVFLEAPFTLSGAPNIGIACLGRPSHAPAQGTRCYGVGWGRLNHKEENNYAGKLKKIEVPIVSRSTCENALRGTQLGSHYRLHETLTCAGGEEGRDVCGGDGGSPLICPLGDAKDNRYVVTGVVAYAIGCGAHGVPGVYVDVPHFSPWVDERVRAQGYDTASYTV